MILVKWHQVQIKYYYLHSCFDIEEHQPSIHFQEDGIYYQRYSFYPKFSDQGKELTCSLDEDTNGEDKEALYDSITIASVVLFDASKCFHCTFDPNGEFSKGKLVTINNKIMMKFGTHHCNDSFQLNMFQPSEHTLQKRDKKPKQMWYLTHILRLIKSQ